MRGQMSFNVEDESRTYSGVVKWFDSAKGYGFVVAEDLERDVLLHANVLRNFGQNSVADGSRISLKVTETPRGSQAQEILSITPPEMPQDGDETRNTLPFDESLKGGDLTPARVKWFDRAKGFGFANVFGQGEDVFIHIEVLRRSSLADLQPGEAIAIRVADGARGKLATQVGVWESAINGADQQDASLEQYDWRQDEAAE